jgi:hypothetical protein
MKLARQLAEDKALRDAALALFKADLRFIRNDLDRRGVGERVTDRLGDGARELADDALDYATAHKGVVATAIAAVILWFARAPLLRALGEMFDGDDGEPEQEAPPRRSSKANKTTGDTA